jgi:type VI protein secretion system component Hcp
MNSLLDYYVDPRREIEGYLKQKDRDYYLASIPRVTTSSKAVMIFPGVKGGVTKKGLEGGIAINTFSFKTLKPVSTQNGHTKNRVIDHPHISHFEFSLKLDQSGVLLWDAMLKGRVATKVTIYFAFAETFKHKAIQWYRRFELSQAIITKCNIHESRLMEKGGRNLYHTMDPSVELAMSVNQFLFEHQVFDAKGRAIKKIPMQYDLGQYTTSEVADAEEDSLEANYPPVM